MGIPFSRLRTNGSIRADIFERMHVVSAAARPVRGLMDSLDEHERADFDSHAVHEDVRDFYENTACWELATRAQWHRGFGYAGRFYKQLSRLMGQMNFPSTGLDERVMHSRLLRLRDEADGRQNVRAWIRTFDNGAVAYAAAYATHSDGESAYMNIAFPLIGGNLTSILRLFAIPSEQSGSGIVLTTLGKGDQGVYLTTHGRGLRVPMNETIQVWPRGHPLAPSPLPCRGGAIPTLVARHDVWLAGLPLLTLDYAMYRV
jgi:hypothetical protein